MNLPSDLSLAIPVARRARNENSFSLQLHTAKLAFSRDIYMHPVVLLLQEQFPRIRQDDESQWLSTTDALRKGHYRSSCLGRSPSRTGLLFFVMDSLEIFYRYIRRTGAANIPRWYTSQIFSFVDAQSGLVKPADIIRACGTKDK